MFTVMFQVVIIVNFLVSKVCTFSMLLTTCILKLPDLYLMRTMVLFLYQLY